MKRMPRSASCATEFALELLGGKWATVILARLKEGPLRYSDLRRLLPTLSEKVLTQRLEDLQERGLVAKRSVDAASTRYVLTADAQALRPALQHLYEWGEAQAERFNVTILDRVLEPVEE
ncbi:MAG TPA: helix-turn-helix domain-containing protein [Burkholderiaceae bacterium]|jgi:DNA-binding HxlR family transcriptional regulator